MSPRVHGNARYSPAYLAELAELAREPDAAGVLVRRWEQLALAFDGLARRTEAVIDALDGLAARPVPRPSRRQAQALRVLAVSDVHARDVTGRELATFRACARRGWARLSTVREVWMLTARGARELAVLDARERASRARQVDLWEGAR